MDITNLLELLEQHGQVSGAARPYIRKADDSLQHGDTTNARLYSAKAEELLMQEKVVLEEALGNCPGPGSWAYATTLRNSADATEWLLQLAYELQGWAYLDEATGRGGQSAELLGDNGVKGLEAAVEKFQKAYEILARFATPSTEAMLRSEEVAALPLAAELHLHAAKWLEKVATMHVVACTMLGDNAYSRGAFDKAAQWYYKATNMREDATVKLAGLNLELLTLSQSTEQRIAVSKN